MSIIHQALSQTNSNSSSRKGRRFNPLADKSNHTQSQIWMPIAGGILLSAAAALVLWPDGPTQIQPEAALVETTPENASTVATTTQADSIVAREITQPAAQSDLRTQEELIEPVSSETETLLIDALIAPAESNIAQNTETVTKENEAPVVETTTNTEPKAEPAAPVTESKPDEDVASAKEVAPTETIIQRSDDSGLQNTAGTTQEVVSKPSTSISESVERERTIAAGSSVKQAAQDWTESVTTFVADGELEKAEQQLKTWIATTPSDATPRIWLAKIYINNGFHRAAEPLLSSVNTLEAKALLGVIYERTDRPALAAVTFEELYRREPTQGKWLLFWAINAENTGELAKSITLYQNYLKGFALEDANLRTFADNRLRVLQGQ